MLSMMVDHHSLVDVITHSTLSDAANQDLNNNNNGYNAPTAAAGGAGAMMGHPNNANYNDLSKDLDGTYQEDRTSHHISYSLLCSTLNFFSHQCAGLHARLRDTLNNKPMIMGSSAICR